MSENTKMKLFHVRTSFLVFAVILLMAFVSMIPKQPKEAQAQAYLVQPYIYQNTTTSVGWTAGTINNGGRAVAITASTGAVTRDMNDCTSPQFKSCNIVYANSGGTVSVTAASNAIAVAMQSGNTILAYVETNTTNGAITQIVYPQQSSMSTGLNTSQTECLASSTCATPTTGASVKIAQGSATLVAGTIAVTGIPAFSAFTTATLAPSFGCMAMLNATTTTAAAQSISCVPVSSSSLTITVGASASATDKVRWIAIGY